MEFVYFYNTKYNIMGCVAGGLRVHHVVREKKEKEKEKRKKDKKGA